MWAEFEWENKVAVNTAISEPLAFLDHIIASTNMVRAFLGGEHTCTRGDLCGAGCCGLCLVHSVLLGCALASAHLVLSLLAAPSHQPARATLRLPFLVQRCLTPHSALEGDCGFLAANLYARRCARQGPWLRHGGD